MNRSLVSLIVGLLVLLRPVILQAQEGCNLSAALQDAVNGYLSSTGTRYSGTLLVEYAGEREFLDVRATDNGASVYFRRLNGIADSPERAITAGAAEPRDACELNAYYSFIAEPGRAVAGRATYRLTVRPRDTLRLAQILDIDAESHVALRGVTVSPEGAVLERYEFATIAFELAPQSLANDTENPPARYRFTALPPGFKIVGQGRNPVDFMVLSDGLATASVFVELQPRSLPSGEGMVLRGATLTFTHGVAASLLVTVVGEIPVATARLLAEAVRVSVAS